MQKVTDEQRAFIAEQHEKVRQIRRMSWLPLAIAVWMAASLAGVLGATALPAWMVADTNSLELKIILFIAGFAALRAWARYKEVTNAEIED